MQLPFSRGKLLHEGWVTDYVILLITIGVPTLLGNRYLPTVLARSKMVMNSFGNKNFR
jgi:hypothetical protein